MRLHILCWLAAPVAAEILLAAIVPAHAQTVGDLGGPVTQGPADTGTNQTAGTSPPQVGAAGHSSLFNQQQAGEAPAAPEWTFTPSIGITEIATDNVAETHTDPQKDLESIGSLGGTITADTPHLSGILSASGLYRRDINDTSQDQFSEYAYGQGNFVANALSVGFHGAIDDISNLNSGVQNALLQAPQDTHTYTLSASPALFTQFNEIGFDLLRYQIGAAWFANSSQNKVVIPGITPGPISASTNQSVQNDLKMAGTLIDRLMSDLSMSAMQNVSGNLAAGIYRNANFELINEYEVTRAASVIAGGGYEWLQDTAVASVGGQGPVWDVGTRLKPNADSSILLTYGEHDRFTDISGEASWQVTLFVNLYAAYTDSLGSVQQSLIGNTSASALSPEGAVSDVLLDQSTVIGTLDDAALSAGPGQASAGTPTGFSLADASNFLPGENGLFRSKTFRANAEATIFDNALTLSLYHAQNISETPLVTPSDTVEGANLSWHPPLSGPITATALIGYVRTGIANSDTMNGELSLNWALSDRIAAVLRYDYIQRDAHPNTVSFLQNSLTLSLQASFD